MSMTSSKDTDTEWGRAIEKPLLISTDTAVASKTNESSNHEAVDIAIVGGGLVGLAAAIGLLRNKPDLTIKIYERAPELRSQSQGILSVHPNGMNALEQIHAEIPKRVQDVGCERHTRTVTDIDADGNAKDTVSDTRDDSLSKFGRVAIGITWHNAQQVLASLVPNKEENIVTSRSLSCFVEKEESVLLHFEDGSVVDAKIALACDGVFSAARRQLYPRDSPIFFGQLNWGTVIESSKLPPNLHETNGVHYFQHHGNPLWMSMLNDGGSGYTFWQFRVSDPEQSMQLSGNNGRGGLGLPGVKEKLLRIAKESCPTVSAAMEAIPEEEIFERSIVGRSSLPTWLSPGGRLALVGDSAHGMHPNIAQGANSSFESAAAVVKALCETESDNLVSALQCYEHERKPRADLVQQFANALGVTQAAGVHLFPFSEALEMMSWIRSGKNPSEHPPPKAVVDVLRQFDPLQTKGVSHLWK